LTPPLVVSSTPLVDDPFVEVTIDGAAAEGRVAPAWAEACCAGHFPDDPLLPGAYLLELMTMLAARLPGAGPAPPEVERCAFLSRVRPTHRIVVAVRRLEPGIVAASLSADGTRAAQATLHVGAAA